MNIAKNIKTDAAKIAILGIIPRRGFFNLKVKQVNKTLKKICDISESCIEIEIKLNFMKPFKAPQRSVKIKI